MSMLADLPVEELARRMMPTIGSLCSGYGGLDMAVEEFFDAETAWFAEYDAAPSKVLAHHWPGVPNLGDMTAIDWASVPKVDIITGGTPCQDLSTAGRRQGMTEGTRSNLWVQMRECIAAVRPSVVAWENVRGALSAYATSEVESEQGLLGESYGPDRPALRAILRVLGDLAELGFDAELVLVRASDAGAPHARFRAFVVAYADHGNGHGRERSAGRSSVTRASAARRGRGAARDAENVVSERSRAVRGEGARDPRGRSGASARDSNVAGLEGRPVRGERASERPAGPDGVGVEWGAYEPAIRRWERVLGRVAPAPTNPDGKGGAHRLAPEFVEWMMGLDPGHVTASEIGLTRNEQLRALGNGVVPQQALLALSIAWPRLADVREQVAA